MGSESENIAGSYRFFIYAVLRSTTRILEVFLWLGYSDNALDAFDLRLFIIADDVFKFIFVAYLRKHGSDKSDRSIA